MSFVFYLLLSCLYGEMFVVVALETSECVSNTSRPLCNAMQGAIALVALSMAQVWRRMSSLCSSMFPYLMVLKPNPKLAQWTARLLLINETDV